MTIGTPSAQEQFALQREFFRIDDATTNRMRKLKPRLMAYTGVVLDMMFDHLSSNPEVGDYFEDSENLRYLLDGMLAHCDLVCSMRFDARYYEAVDQMGLRHSKLNYPSHAYTSAYANLLDGITQLGLMDSKPLNGQDLSAVTRVCIYDMELTIAAFFRHQLDKQAALHADTEKVRSLLTRDRLAS
jgi:hypothetical protein